MGVFFNMYGLHMDVNTGVATVYNVYFFTSCTILIIRSTFYNNTQL